MTTHQPTRWEKAADKLTSAIPYVGAGAIIIPGLYMLWFLYQGQTISTDTAHWGTFGDFVGGILNPVVAFFALLLLMISIGIQREELRATRDELKEVNKHNERSNQKEDINRAIASIEKRIISLLEKPAPSSRQNTEYHLIQIFDNLGLSGSFTGIRVTIPKATTDRLSSLFIELAQYLRRYKEVSDNAFFTLHMKNKYYEVIFALTQLADTDSNHDLDFYGMNSMDDVLQVAGVNH